MTTKPGRGVGAADQCSAVLGVPSEPAVVTATPGKGIEKWPLSVAKPRPSGGRPQENAPPPISCRSLALLACLIYVSESLIGKIEKANAPASKRSPETLARRSTLEASDAERYRSFEPVRTIPGSPDALRRRPSPKCHSWNTLVKMTKQGSQ
ncbi:hypothetical protein [Salininema proteolyticum]|uniref:Uncharacterized protein n=1 Tax=Salininema proteolyticum TaxID=1607685 RepID=A0ABV8TUA1_9ACTN